MPAAKAATMTEAAEIPTANGRSPQVFRTRSPHNNIRLSRALEMH
jgi:hypothetical protein